MPKIIDEVEILNTIVCEDVRQEISGKWSILGTFSGDIIVPVLPTNIKLALYMESNVTKPYKGPMNLRMRLDNDVILEAPGRMDSKVGITVMPIPQFVIGVDHPGRLTVEVGTDDRWFEVSAKKLILGKMKDGNVVLPDA